jgi:hypothetical protein
MNVKNALMLALALGSAIPAFAGTVTYTCDPNVAVATCTYLNTTVANMYNSTFTDANADIYIQYGTTGLASTESPLDGMPYSAYLAFLTANPDQSALQASALSALNTYDNAPYGTGIVEVTPALAEAFGVPASDLGGITSTGGFCIMGTSGCYNAVVTVSNTTPLYYNIGTESGAEYDYYAAVEHETDEVLGTASCITTQTSPLSDDCAFFGAGTPSAVDLFRYSAPGSLVLDSSLSTTPGAYFSYNGGVTNGANGFVYNTLDNGDDYADFLNSCPAGPFSVQDAQGCPGTDSSLTILSDGGAEINILNAVGYDLVSSERSSSVTPEPGTFMLLASGLGTLVAFRRRRR